MYLSKHGGMFETIAFEKFNREKRSASLCLGGKEDGSCVLEVRLGAERGVFMQFLQASASQLRGAGQDVPLRPPTA